MISTFPVIRTLLLILSLVAVTVYATDSTTDNRTYAEMYPHTAAALAKARPVTASSEAIVKDDSAPDPFQIGFIVVLSYLLAGAVGYGLYRLITVREAVSSPSDYGRSWMASMVFLFTVLPPTLPRFIQLFEVNALVQWLLSIVFFGVGAFALGWIYGKLFGNEKVEVTSQVISDSNQLDKPIKSPVSVGLKWLYIGVVIGIWNSFLTFYFRNISIHAAIQNGILIILMLGAVAFVTGWIYAKFFRKQGVTLLTSKKSSRDLMNSEWQKEEKTSKISNSQANSEHIDAESLGPGDDTVNQDMPVINNRYSYKKARLAIEYRPEAKSAFESLREFPKEFKIKFLDLLDENPKGPIGTYLDQVKKEYDSWLNPYDNKNINVALNEARNLGPQAEKEFRKIVDTLGDSVEPKEVISKIKEKMVAISNDPRETLDELQQAYRMDSDQLMKHFGINYNYGEYVYKERRYEQFVDAAIAADRDHVSESIGP